MRTLGLLPLVTALLLVSGCGSSPDLESEVSDVSGDAGQLPAVADASYDYSDDSTAGQYIGLDVSMRANASRSDILDVRDSYATGLDDLDLGEFEVALRIDVDGSVFVQNHFAGTGAHDSDACWDRWLDVREVDDAQSVDSDVTACNADEQEQDVRVTLPAEAGPDGVAAMYASLRETVDDNADVGWVVEAPPGAPVEFTTGLPTPTEIDRIG